MPKKWRDLYDKMPAARRAQVEARVRETTKGLSLRDLREHCELTQGVMAERMDTTQPEISKIEQRTDCLVSTLRNYLEGLGAELELVARFPDGGEVRIKQFLEVRERVGV
jgi:DNA-binding transcriptional regulator YiaG